MAKLRSEAMRWRGGLLLAADLLAWYAALGVATWLADAMLAVIDGRRVVVLAAILTVLYGALGSANRFHIARTRIGSIDEMRRLVPTWTAVAALVILANEFVLDGPLPLRVLLASMPIALFLMLVARGAWRSYQDVRLAPTGGVAPKRVVVFGAGEGGEQIVRSMRRDRSSAYMPVALLDDDPHKRNRVVSGITVDGSRDDMVAVAAATGAEILLIAIPSASSALITELTDAADAAGLEVRVLPSTSELLGLLRVDDIREPTEADLLGRAEVAVDLDAISSYVTKRTVLVTGAGGSIGSELCRQLYQLAPRNLIMLDRDESALHALQLSIEGRALLDTGALVVADIRDAGRLDEVFAEHQPDVVFHAAALKHLTLLERNAGEGIKTNVLGTANVLDAARRHGVDRFVNVSTDKAADPTSVLGITKLAAERLTAQVAEDTGRTYVSVRFGNVLGSRGSVLPTFRHQIAEGGPVTVTHPDVTRYFMTIPEAVRLVLQAGADALPGEICILDMGNPVKIADLARRLIELSDSAAEIVYTGLRRGEKLHEVLRAADEVGVNRSHERVFHTGGCTSLEPTSLAASAPGLLLTADAIRTELAIHSRLAARDQ